MLVQDSNQLSQQANWDLVINFSPFKPVKGEDEIIIIICCIEYVNQCYWMSIVVLNTAISRKVVGKSVYATIPKGNMGYDRYTLPDTVAVEPTFLAFL